MCNSNTTEIKSRGFSVTAENWQHDTKVEIVVDVVEVGPYNDKLEGTFTLLGSTNDPPIQLTTKVFEDDDELEYDPMDQVELYARQLASNTLDAAVVLAEAWVELKKVAEPA